MIERCYQRSKVVINPIIDWLDTDVWEFIHEYNIPYCKLYDEGFKRLGCIGCPMGSHRVDELERYPKFKQAYLNAFRRMLDNRGEKQEYSWKNADEVFDWWVKG